MMTGNDWNSYNLEIELVNDGELPDEILEGSPAPADVLEDGEHHLEDAVTAQVAADLAAEVGDYESAQQLREIAEDELAAAGSDAILDGPTSTELEQAVVHQERAEALELEQAEQAQAGDYELARESAQNAVVETQAADALADGSDHSGQAQLEVDNMDWADFHQSMADESVAAAVEYAEAGNIEAADNALGDAMDEKVAADYYGDLGEHGNAIADVDPSSEVETNHVDVYSPSDVDIAGSSLKIDTTTTDFSIDTTSTDDFSS